MDNLHTIIYGEVRPETLAVTAEAILREAPENRIFLLQGGLGAGKTTLVKAFCDILGCKGQVTSPTFSIVNQYDSNGNQIYHMDLYRLESEEEVFDIGMEDYLASGKYCFIEWPDIVLPFIQGPFAEILIETVGENVRKMTCTWYPDENL
jgi:tRNA threonylcarbamoyladenosine biosynthesis protein TsaE